MWNSRPFIAVVIWMGLICASSSTVATPTRFFNWISANALGKGAIYDAFVIFWGLSWFVIVKGWHAVEFAIVYLLLHRSIAAFSRGDPAVYRVLAWVLACSFAIFDEWRQTFVPERGGTWIDVGIDCLGVSAAFLREIWLKSRTIPSQTPASGSPDPDILPLSSG